jgi:hypothetical protein
MATATRTGDSDLYLPLPERGQRLHHHTIHTHYFSFSVPDQAISAFVYVRYQPAFALCQGGVCIYRGMDNPSPLDSDHLDWQNTMPWPDIDGTAITTANGVRIEFLEPGERVRLTYASADGETAFDVTQVAVTPLLARGHVMPGEAERADDLLSPGGSEQFMHCIGSLTLQGDSFAVDCHAARDRSWNQVRVEDRGAVVSPPVAWTPMYFSPDLIFNQISFESVDTRPAWTGLFEIAAERPTHHFAWILVDGALRQVVRVRREVLEYHPQLYGAVRQEVEAEDEDGHVHRFAGDAIAMAAIPAWPNAALRDSLYRWYDEDGRVTHASCQEIWFEDYQRAMKLGARL